MLLCGIFAMAACSYGVRTLATDMAFGRRLYKPRWLMRSCMSLTSQVRRLVSSTASNYKTLWREMGAESAPN